MNKNKTYICSMQLAKCFIIPGLCLLMGACVLGVEDPVVKLNIGDYDHQLAGWNNNKMMDYQLSLYYCGDQNVQAFITVRNGIPESSDPPEWLERGKKSTVPEFFSFIKEFEEKLRNGRGIFDGPGRSTVTYTGHFTVNYNTEYYYPRLITYAPFSTPDDGTFEWQWIIKLTPLEMGASP